MPAFAVCASHLDWNRQPVVPVFSPTIIRWPMSPPTAIEPFPPITNFPHYGRARKVSLLFWSFFAFDLCVFGPLYLPAGKHPELMPYVGVVLGGAFQIFFLTMNNFVCQPFSECFAAPRRWRNSASGERRAEWKRPQSASCNIPKMAIHPPTLYSGYTGFTIPFRVCSGPRLLGRYPGEKWIHLTRRWTDDLLGFSVGRNFARRALGLCRPWMGRVTGGGIRVEERISDAVAHRYGLSCIR